MHVTIIGGGITGLAAAYYLQQEAASNHLPLSYALLEASERWGGKIITAARDGFIMEGGPDSFITQKPQALALCKDLGLEGQLIPCNQAQQHVFIMHHGRLEKLPAGFRLTVPTQWGPLFTTPLLSFASKCRMAVEPFISVKNDETDESLASFVRRRFGQGALEHIAGPLMAGIYVSDPEHLSMKATFSMFLDMEKTHGSLVKAMRARSRQTGSPPPMFMSLRNGMQTLVDALVDRCTGDLRTHAGVSSIERQDKGFRIHVKDHVSIESGAVIVTLPAHQASNLVEPLHAEAAEALRSIRFVSTTTLTLGYKRSALPPDQDLNGFGFIVPPSENKNIIACTWSSNKFDHRAPADDVLLRVFFGGYAREELAEQPDELLLDMAKQELSHIININTEPEFSKIFRWTKGNPQYDVGHLDKVDYIDGLLSQTPGIYLAGSSYRGLGISDCMAQAKRVVGDLVKTLH